MIECLSRQNDFRAWIVNLACCIVHLKALIYVYVCKGSAEKIFAQAPHRHSFFNLSPNLFDWLSVYLCLLLFVCELTSWGPSEKLKPTVQESFHVRACFLCDISRGRIQCNLENIIDLDSSETRGHTWERREGIYSDGSLDSSLLISSCIFRLFLQLWAILSPSTHLKFSLVWFVFLTMSNSRHTCIAGEFCYFCEQI